jgi:NAD(P)-dependent dehydrogenase (short-subunit alcohol dehydrogenase family)
MFELDEKTAIVTGGGSGIGRAIAKLFAAQGAMVYVIDLNEQDGASVVEEIRSDSGKAAYRKTNVASHIEVKKSIDEIAADSSSIDILLNIAGIAHIGNAENTAEADFDRIFQVNVKGIYNCLHAVIPYMKDLGGVILNMASVAATVGIPDRFAYSTTKAAVIGMTLSVAKDYIRHKIRCNCISPGRVHTPFVDGFLSRSYPGKEKEMFEKLSKTQPIGRMAKPEEVASLALFLCSEEASFITGCDYAIDGGFIRLNN